MIVTRAQLEAQIEALRREVADPRAGIHGPDSIAWRIGRESALLLGGGCAALLQLSHPFVAYAIEQHSHTRRDPVGRFHRTFANVYAMVFGDLESAIRSARHVHAIHARIVGTIEHDIGHYAAGSSYRANDPHALLWVHATLVDTAVRIYDLVVQPLSDAEKEAYYQESKRFARLFAIPDTVLPPDWAAFTRYFAATLASNAIVVSPPAVAVGSFLMRSPRPIATVPIHVLRVITAGLLPPHVRDAFDLPFTPRERSHYETAIATLRRTYRFLPGRLRFVPAYVEARRRLAGKPRPDRFGRAIERTVLHVLRPSATDR